MIRLENGNQSPDKKMIKIEVSNRNSEENIPIEVDKNRNLENPELREESPAEENKAPSSDHLTID
jgi:hypothetical protein